MFSDFVHHIQSGGSADSFLDSPQVDRTVVASFSGYFKELNAKVAEGAAGLILDEYVDKYTTAAEAHRGIEIDRDVDTVFEFDMDSDKTVMVPYAPWIPKEYAWERTPQRPDGSE